MNREHLRPDKVLVYETVTKKQAEQPVLARFEAQSYPLFGLDHYKWEGKLYKGYRVPHDGEGYAAIFLDSPLFKGQP